MAVVPIVRLFHFRLGNEIEHLLVGVQLFGCDSSLGPREILTTECPPVDHPVDPGQPLVEILRSPRLQSAENGEQLFEIIQPVCLRLAGFF